MKIYLRNIQSREWELKEGSLENLQQELRDRNITISSTVNIGDEANIGYKANIGDEANIGNYANKCV